jgi:hypothetical protein
MAAVRTVAGRGSVNKTATNNGLFNRLSAGVKRFLSHAAEVAKPQPIPRPAPKLEQRYQPNRGFLPPRQLGNGAIAYHSSRPCPVCWKERTIFVGSVCLKCSSNDGVRETVGAA